MFHGRWFEHGSRTVLREAAGTQEVFLTNECDDIDAEAVVTKAHVRFLALKEAEPFNNIDPELFFCRYVSIRNMIVSDGS